MINKIFSQGVVALDVSVSNKSPKYALVGFPDFFPDDPEIKLFYQKNDVNNQIKIFPQMEYLSKLERGEPISDLYGGGGFPYFDWQFPNLDLRIVNNTKETVYVTDIVLEVEESKIDFSHKETASITSTKLIAFFI